MDPTPGNNTNILENRHPRLGFLLMDVFEGFNDSRKFMGVPTIELGNEWQAQVSVATNNLGLRLGENIDNIEINVGGFSDVLEMLRLQLKPNDKLTDFPYCYGDTIISEYGIDPNVSYKDPRVARERLLRDLNISDLELDLMLTTVLHRLLSLDSEIGIGGLRHGAFSEEGIEIKEYGTVAASQALAMILYELERLNQMQYFQTNEYAKTPKDHAGEEFNISLYKARTFTFIAAVRAWDILDPLPMVVEN